MYRSNFAKIKSFIHPAFTAAHQNDFSCSPIDLLHGVGHFKELVRDSVEVTMPKMMYM